MKLPRHISSTSVRETGLVRAQDIGALTNVGDAEFRAIQQAGRAIGAVSDMAHNAFMKRKKLDEDIRWGNATTKMAEGHGASASALTAADYTVDEPLPGDPDYNKAPLQLSIEKKAKLTAGTLAERDKQAKEIEQSFSTKREKEQFRAWYAQKRVDYDAAYTKINNAKHNAFQVDRLQTLANTAYSDGDIEAGDSYINSMDENELILPAAATKKRTDGRELAVTSAISDIKAVAIKEGDVKTRANLFDMARDLLQGDAIADSTERLDELRSINLLETQLENRDARNRYKRDVANTVDIGERIDPLDAEEDDGVPTMDELLAMYPNHLTSPTERAEVDFWQGILVGKADGVMGRRTGDGYNAVIESLAKLARGTTDTKTFLQDIAKARYVDGTITDETYSWARKRAVSPYPKHLSEMVDTILNARSKYIREVESGTFDSRFTLGDFDTFRYTDAEKKAVGDKVAEEHRKLFKWIDAELEKDPDKIFTPKELNNMAAQVAATVPFISDMPPAGALAPVARKEGDRRVPMYKPNGVLFWVPPDMVEKKIEDNWTIAPEPSIAPVSDREKRYQEYLRLKKKAAE